MGVSGCSCSRKSISYSFTLEWAPDNSFVGDCEFCVALARNDPPKRNILIFNHTDDEITPSTGALDILVKFVDKVISHMGSKVGWMKRNGTVEFVYEEHGCGNSKGMCSVLVREKLLISCYANQERCERQDAFKAFFMRGWVGGDGGREGCDGSSAVLRSLTKNGGRKAE